MQTAIPAINKMNQSIGLNQSDVSLTVLSDSKAGHSVVVTSQHSRSLGLHGVPHVAVEVVVPGQQQTAGLGEGHAGDAADDVVVTVDSEFLVRANVEHPTRGVITSGSKSIAIGEKLRLKQFLKI